MNKRPIAHDIVIKKQFGQHFLRDQSVVDHMLDHVTLNPEISVFEIGCGDGFLTRSILQTSIARLWVFEIDPEWAQYVEKNINDDRLTVYEQNILDLDFESMLKPHAPWTLLSNLPYNVTFPILHLLKRYRHLLREGIIMVQEEVAQKIMKTSGRGYGFISLFFQNYFEWKLLMKIPPQSFYPSPKVFSRLLYFKPRADAKVIPEETEFWKFIKVCFKQPRRTLKNNLAQSHLDIEKIPEETLLLRAQQLSMDDFLKLWDLVR